MGKERKKVEYDVLIIDPASTEFNRGSFCYLPYIVYAAMKEEGTKVKLIENFTAVDLDSLPESKTTLVALWSYPQIELCHFLRRFRKNVLFFGYYELIKAHTLPVVFIPEEDILRGINNYVKYYRDFKFILLSDCDMHLKEYEGQVYPLFTSYGCKNMCSFCPVGINCFHDRIVPSVDEVIESLKVCESEGYKLLHFTDEDFFFDLERTYKILTWMDGRDFKIIALGGIKTVKKFIDAFEFDLLEGAGMKLIEIGLESADLEQARRMRKPGPEKYIELADLILSRNTIDVLWLALTFYPGETINSIKMTGKFLQRYGFSLSRLYDRIRTNGTRGGLGQFFQPYHGTIEFETLGKQGMFLTERPIRLIPSYVPLSFIQCRYAVKQHDFSEYEEWFDLYNLNWKVFDKFLTRNDVVGAFMWDCRKSKLIPYEESSVFLAQLARLDLIDQDGTMVDGEFAHEDLFGTH